MISALLSRCLILFLGTLFPAYRSYKAIKNKDVREHVKWMMYWIVFALFTTMETFLDVFFSWFPFYYEIKILFILWVLSPATRGSSLLYKKVVHPMLTSKEKEIDELIEKTKTQGYNTFLSLFSSGFQYASTVFVNSALQGQYFLGDQLKKSLSMNDINLSSASTGTLQNSATATNLPTSKPPQTIDEDEHEDTDYDQELEQIRRLNNKPIRTRQTNGNYANGQPHTVDYELIDDVADDGDQKKSGTKQRRVNTRAGAATGATTGSAANYRSDQSAHFGTLTRSNKSKATRGAHSIPTAQQHDNNNIYDNDY